jgi:hypothetical protein
MKHAGQKLDGMTTLEEQMWLYEFSKHSGAIDGEIVDLGCWLGSTTLPLLNGINLLGGTRSRIVHAYDLFQWDTWMDEFISGIELQKHYKPGDSFLEEFLARTREYEKLIKVYPEDLTASKWAGGGIALLVIDAMKSWELAENITREFCSHLVTGGYIFHQDFKFWGCPWIHIIWYRLRSHFEVSASLTNSTTVVFTLRDTFAFKLALNEVSWTYPRAKEIDQCYAYWQSQLGPNLQLDWANLFAYSHFLSDDEATRVTEALVGRVLAPPPIKLLNLIKTKQQDFIQKSYRSYRSLADINLDGRLLYLWGAGGKAIRLINSGKIQMSSVSGFIDTDPEKIGSSYYSIQIISAEVFFAIKPRPFVIITSMYMEQISKCLLDKGFRVNSDFIIDISW